MKIRIAMVLIIIGLVILGSVLKSALLIILGGAVFAGCVIAAFDRNKT